MLSVFKDFSPMTTWTGGREWEIKEGVGAQ